MFLSTLVGVLEVVFVQTTLWAVGVTARTAYRAGRWLYYRMRKPAPIVIEPKSAETLEKSNSVLL